MGRSQETFGKKEVRNRKDKKRREKAEKRQARRGSSDKKSLDDMIAYVDENGVIRSTPPEETKEEINAEDIEIGIPRSEDREQEDPIKKGIVSYFNDQKGYGFIKETGSKESIFVHINNALDDIREGNQVSFEVERGAKGWVAVRVKLVK